MLFSDGQHHVLGAEEFRTLRSHLYMIRERQPLQKLLITSALPREGKTFIAGNLAEVIVRQPGRRVLLIDSDLRLSQLHLKLGAPANPGLSDYLRGEADEFAVIQRGPIESLLFIAGGKLAPNPSELIGNGRLKLLLQRLGPAFDWIILDSPPVVPVSDAKLLADLCDGVLVVVQAGTTPYDLARKACQEFREKRLLGVVLNFAEAGSSYSSYYYYGGQARKKR
jgi:capsular exopolysaccharide synthesis family protein